MTPCRALLTSGMPYSVAKVGRVLGLHTLAPSAQRYEHALHRYWSAVPQVAFT